METFQDVNGNQVQISFQRDFFSKAVNMSSLFVAFMGNGY